MLTKGVVGPDGKDLIPEAPAAAGPISSLLDICCCGGGFSLGAAEALGEGLAHVAGVDHDRMALRNFGHNLARLLPKATVEMLEVGAPSSLAGLRALVPTRTVGRGTHVHVSPPCQKLVNATPKVRASFKRELGPYLRLLCDAAAAGCTCSLEEHKDVHKVALDWLAAQPDAADRRALHVYQVTARDYGSPTTRLRCVITTFPLAGETDLNSMWS